MAGYALLMAKPMKNYAEAGAHLTEMTKQQAEAFVKSLAKSSSIRRRDAEQLLQAMVSRGRDTTDRMSALVQGEVAKQLRALSERFDEIEGRFEALASSIKDGIVGAAAGMTGAASEPTAASPPTTSATSHTDTTNAPMTVAKPPTKKTSTKKLDGQEVDGQEGATAKKSPAKKSTAKKSGAKKSPAPRSRRPRSRLAAPAAVGSSGVRKVSTSRPAAASE